MTSHEAEALQTARDYIEASPLAARSDPISQAKLQGLLQGLEIARAALRDRDGSAVAELIDQTTN